MAAPNPHLEAVLRQFGAQGGAGAGLEHQLRAAVTADAARLDLLNDMAASGRLRAFSVDPASASLIGGYDKRTGAIELPAASFHGRELDAVVGVQALVADFAHKSWHDPAGQRHVVTQDMVENLQGTFNGSPVLAAQLKEAIAQSHVQHFSLLQAGMAAGATYDGSTADGTPRGINLPPAALQSRTAANPGGRYDAGDMTFVLGHEIQHGFNRAAKDEATRGFLRDIATQANAHSAIHDYSDELRAYLGASRDDEARAEIAGWNALLDRLRQSNPNGDGLVLMLNTQNDRVLDFIQPDPLNPARAAAKPGLSFNPDGSLSQTPANIAAMGQHYFDRPAPAYAQPGQRPVALGEHRPASADYTNYYGTWAVERIVAAEDRAGLLHRGQRPRIAIDMAGLGMREDLIEMEGLDLGANRAPRPYIDTSRTPAAPGRFHHTQDASMGHDHRHVPVARIQPPRASGDAVVDAWMAALLAGDDAAARAVQRSFADSAEGQRLWAEGTGAAGRKVDAPSPYAAPWIAAEPHTHDQPQLQHAMER